MDIQTGLDRVFHPKVLAVVGAKRDNDYMWLRAHGPFAEFGKIYHVNIDQAEWPGAEELGVPNVSSLLDIPEPVDYVAISVPNVVVPRVLQDCAAKGVGGAHIFAAGFAETGTEQGQQLEEAVRKIAVEGDFLVIGPNCMGLYNPALGIRPGRDLPYGGTDGYFSFLSQSGTTSMSIASGAPANGIEVSKGASFGNGTVVDATDYLRYYAADEATEVIGMYLEGVHDGPAFFDALREAAARKPVLVWKVGSTSESARAGFAHTRSEAVPAELWDAMLTVCGAIKVSSIEEMLETAMALRYVGDPGVDSALIAVSGGHSGKIADVFGQQGFRIPSPSDASLEEIASYADIMGGSFSNPFEGPSVRGPDLLERTLGVLAHDDNFDVIVVEFGAGAVKQSPDALDERIEVLSKVREQQPDKSIVTVVSTDIPYVEGVDVNAVARAFLDAGLPCFLSMERGAIALRKAREYQRRSTWLLPNSA
jgi:acyl-CoA synthetase (NDP forming)